MAHWLRLHASTARGTSVVPGWGTKIPHAVWHSQKKKKKERKKIDNLNKPTASENFELVIKKLHKKESPSPEGFTTEFHQTFKEDDHVNSSQTLSKNRRGMNSSQLLFRNQYYPDTKIRQKHH